jgi:uncharacterized protein (TIGR02186 family)
MNTARSTDGTTIAYETFGQGPPLILVDGALCYRKMGPSRALAKVLGEHFTVVTYDRGGADEPFRDALLRLKRREGLYLEQERGVTFLTPSLFRASIPLPATAPPGNYDVEVVLLADTVILARTQTSFEMVKIGFEQQVGEMARDLAPLYGGATALLALFFGYVASIIFRRD